MICGGVVRTRSTGSPSTVFAWLLHAHPPNVPIRVLHDPSGPSLKIAGESIWLTYRWDNILSVFVWMAVFLALGAFIRRRLQFLETLPETYDASPPASPSENRNDLLDLKLS
jgi:hypothetical protein